MTTPTKDSVIKLFEKFQDHDDGAIAAEAKYFISQFKNLGALSARGRESLFYRLNSKSINTAIIPEISFREVCERALTVVKEFEPISTIDESLVSSTSTSATASSTSSRNSVPSHFFSPPSGMPIQLLFDLQTISSDPPTNQDGRPDCVIS